MIHLCSRMYPFLTMLVCKPSTSVFDGTSLFYIQCIEETMRCFGLCSVSYFFTKFSSKGEHKVVELERSGFKILALKFMSYTN